jgi:hypothetical protein
VHEDTSGKEYEDDKSRNEVQNDISHHSNTGLRRLRFVTYVHPDQLQSSHIVAPMTL